MAERHRSQDGRQETRAYTDSEETPSHHGRADGGVERQVGTRDLLKRAEQDRPGVTRVRKSEEKSGS